MSLLIKGSYDKEEEGGVIYEKSYEKSDISLKGYKPLYIMIEPGFFRNKRRVDDKMLGDLSVHFTVAGKDRKQWAGFYGPKISSIFLKILPADRDEEKHMLLFSQRHSL